MEVALPLNPKLLSYRDALHLRNEKRTLKKKIVLTNGCFDLLHIGHVHSLLEASKLGDELWVALNTDESVKKLKGELRPIYPQLHRAFLLHALSCVDYLFFFNSVDLSDEILNLAPDIYVKSGDYNIEKLNKKEFDSLKKVGADIHFVPFLKGISTTNTLAQYSNNQ